MNTDHIYPVILAGGKGERFWPSSRIKRPKQFIPLLSKTTLFEETLTRSGFLTSSFNNIIIVTSKLLRKQVLNAVKGKKCTIIEEPVGKNTAPAIAAAASYILSKDPQGVMVVLTSDHKISPVKEFVKTIKTGIDAARKGYLVVFGIKPVRPDTGYGYIQKAEKLGNIFNVKKFHEKPDLKTAKMFYKKGFLWNSGMFVWKAETIMDEFKHQMPLLYNLSDKLKKFWGSKKENYSINNFYHKAESQSIDYGIMEGAKKVAVVTSQFQWDDVGSWEALWRHRFKDKNGNVTYGQTISMDNKDSLLFAEKGLIVGAGLKNMIVVHSNNATLVIPRDYLSNIKKITAMIRKNKDITSFLE